MEPTFKNKVLNRDVKEFFKTILEIEVLKGNISGYSIEVVNNTNDVGGSYLYNDKVKDRDNDYNLLLEVLETIIEEKENG